MKFSQLGQLALASAVSAALVLGITACGQSNTVDYIYVASANSNPGAIYGFAANGQSGALAGLLGSPFPAGRNPIGLVTSPNNTSVYALNHDDNTVSYYVAGTDGKLFAQATYNLQSGTNPNGMALSPDGSTLYVVEAYGLDAAGNPYSATTPGIGALVQIPVNSDGTLGTETAYPTCNNPVAVNVLTSGKAVYVVNDPSGQLTTLIDTMAAVNRGATGGATVIYPSAGACLGGAGAKGQISGYTVSSNNTLTPAAGSPFSAGTAPNAITSDTSSSFLYVTDFATSQMYSYTVQTSNGALSPLANAQATGQSPSAVTTVAIAPDNKYIYVANYGANTVSGFSIGQGGTPTALPGTSNTSAVDAGPASVLIENSDQYVYTANFIAGTVSSLFLDPNAGTFHPGQRTPFPGVAKATAVASVKHHTVR